MLLTHLWSKDLTTLVGEVAAASFLVYLLGLFIYNRYFHPLKDFPGPFWASVTSLWYCRAVRCGRGDDYQLPIHKKYGTFVRLAPNLVQISDPAAIETIYGPKHEFVKGDFYLGFNPKISKRQDNFTEANEAAHTRRRRTVAHLYTQAAVLEYEPCVDRCIALFYKRMEEFAASGAVTDMAVWLRKYTFDIIGEIFYGREGGFGFIRDNIDYNNWCHLMDVMPNPVAAISYVPYGLRNLYFMFQMLWPETRAGAKGFFTVIDQSHAAVKQRLDDIAAGKPVNRQDVLSKLLDIVSEGKHADFGLLDVTTEIWTMIWAGSDTTSIALCSIFYHLHKNPATLAKLREEIDTAFADGTLKKPIRFNDAIKLPYLHAVVREAMRIHGSLGTGLPRVVPPGGVEICGRYFAGGTEVIMNSNAVQFDKAVFGHDSESFVPERWLRDGERAAAHMERHTLQFGYGKRICIGRHITNTEMYKLLPTILHDFEFELVGNREWEVWRGWFHQPKNVNVRVTRRAPNLKS
ncbi:hypothetical protein HRR83_003937 [Exophiala dermatitidis]|uniref:Cytochrome P450 oxidoreductase n=2 Tax=Exophiala dermatitidis TaxID=5970 RepID=H6BPZ9_EXODN|nr:cytochrome P450 oxidoreductase [Exophiala dermatitidis NIH/UT8656]KAJ4518780.1 hypothetical protein HRR75_002453 [Exophiala dermatitidis]EHY53724.1 cytochrome P450 oxidoreductase [Exophiala dermatitidis NIH/UT8656]KAJ4522098.1 hypothetical protein HRR74_002678 [Exophiala dermatitidis]KAJ4529424.1 hypothetical protein HRR73_000447 [Exophiala dermatitidis]KAJ4543920.1 hypothetical protein HRR76_001979 [Exophiala dermatitidis]